MYVCVHFFVGYIIPEDGLTKTSLPSSPVPTESTSAEGEICYCNATIFCIRDLCILAKIWLIQVLCDLIFVILGCAFCSPSPSPIYCKAILTIAVENNATLHSRSLRELPPCPLHDLPARRTLQSKTIVALIRLQKRSLLLLSQVQHQWCGCSLTTPTKRHSHKPICLTIVFAML